MRAGILCGVLAAVFLATPRGPREPADQGKTLTQWIKQAMGATIPGESAEAQAAVQAIGTNALPFLLKEFARPVSRSTLPPDAKENAFPPPATHLSPEQKRVSVAAMGLTLLGTHAAPAIPDMLRHLGDPERGSRAVNFLAQGGAAAVPQLLVALNSTNPVVVGDATSALRQLAYRPGPAQDALLDALHHPRAEVRLAVLSALDSQLPFLREGVPALEKLADDPSPAVRQAASNLVWRWNQTMLRSSGDVPLQYARPLLVPDAPRRAE